MVSAHVATDVFTLVKIGIVDVFLHAWLTHVSTGAHDYACARGLVSIVQDISICNVRVVNRSSSFDHWQLLCV
jgi:hypothetical protein